MVGGKLGKCPPASPMLVLGHQNNFAPGRSACPVRAVPATGGPPPRTHGSAGQAQGAGEQNPGQEAGPSAGPGMWSTGSRSRAWRRTRTSVGQSPSLAHAALRYAAPPAGATTSSLDLALPAPSPTSRRLACLVPCCHPSHATLPLLTLCPTHATLFCCHAIAIAMPYMDSYCPRPRISCPAAQPGQEGR